MSEEQQKRLNRALFALNTHMGDHIDALVEGDMITFRAFINKGDSRPYKYLITSMRGWDGDEGLGMFVMVVMNAQWERGIPPSTAPLPFDNLANGK